MVQRQGVATALMNAGAEAMQGKVDILGFDHSTEANPLIPYMASKLQSGKKVKKIGSQDYYVLK